MKQIKQGIGLLLSCMLVLSLAACGGSSDDDQVTWILAHTITEDTALHKACMSVAEQVAEATDGKFVIEVYPNSQMGGNREVLEGMQFGTFQATVPNVAMLGGYSSKVSVLELPYLIEDTSNFDDAHAVFDSDVLEPIYEELEEAGFQWMAAWYQGNRHLTTTKTPVHSPADMKGLKIRTMESEYHMAHFNALGANAIPMAFSEVFTALQQGAIDGQENPYVNIYTQGMHEVQGYVIETAHIWDVIPLVVSKAAYDDLPPEYQKALEDAVAVATEEEWNLAAQQEEEYKQKILETGKTEIIELTPEERQAFKDAAAPVYAQCAEVIGNDLIEAIADAQK